MSPGPGGRSMQGEAPLDLEALHRSLALGGTLLQAPGAAPLLLVERVRHHGLPQVAVLARWGEDPSAPIKAMEALHREGLALNLILLLSPRDDPQETLAAHRRRIGTLVCALDAGIPWPPGGPLLAKRLPGRIWSASPVPLPPGRLSPLEWAQLRAREPGADAQAAREAYLGPSWRQDGEGWEGAWWPEVPLPEGVRSLVPPLELPADPVAEAVRAALRVQAGGPVPALPLRADPRPLHALEALCGARGIFRGEVPAWKDLLLRLAQLPAPPHFCARC